MSRSSKHTHHTDTTRNRIAKDAENVARRRADADADLDLDYDCDESCGVVDDEASDAEFAAQRAQLADTRELTAAEVEEGYLPAVQVFGFNPNRYEFRWNDDFSGFIPVKLRWWDDASYIAYQADCGESEDDYRPDVDESNWEAPTVARSDDPTAEELADWAECGTDPAVIEAVAEDACPF